MQITPSRVPGFAALVLLEASEVLIRKDAAEAILKLAKERRCSPEQVIASMLELTLHYNGYIGKNNLRCRWCGEPIEDKPDTLIGFEGGDCRKCQQGKAQCQECGTSGLRVYGTCPVCRTFQTVPVAF
jgi:hypothetical protein